MRHKAQLVLFVIAALGTFVAMPATAWAQHRRTPYADLNAAGADVGLFVPHQDGMSTGPLIEGFFEHYMSARDSLRVDVGWMNPHRSDDSNVKTREVRIGGNLLHNWEGGAVHPYVGAGLGVYFLQTRINGNNAGSGATKFGGALIGGIEFFTSRTFSVKGEAAYHIVTDSGSYDPSGLALSIGVKAYF